MLARPFDGDPERYFWLYAGEAESHAFGFLRLCEAHGRGRPARVGLVGALSQTALSLSRLVPEVSVYDPDVQRVAALSVRAIWAGASGVQVRTSPLSEGLDAVLAPACLLSSLESDDAAVDFLGGVADALAPGGLLVATVCHPRFALGAAPSSSRQAIPPSHGWPAGSARSAFVRASAPLPRMDLQIHVDDHRGLPLAHTLAAVRLLTLAEWRAVLARVPELEETALAGALAGPRPYLELAGDECVLVLVKSAAPPARRRRS